MASLGHYLDADGRSAFRVFAPERALLSVYLPKDGMSLRMMRDELGYWHCSCDRLPDGTRYLIEVDGQRLPDFASRHQPDGVHAASAVVTTRRASSPGWHGVRLEDAVIYELHLGTFTQEGTLAAASERLPALADLGVTAIELLPIAAFPGDRNWGYDGVYAFALQQSYGDYEQLAGFIESAHSHGIAVLLDVVYNHFGPEGNYSARFAPYTKAAETPWGAAINFNSDFNYGVREFFLENLRYWIEDIGFDGLRMDAVSMIFDDMPVHILREVNDLAKAIGQREGREIMLIAEHLRSNRFVTSEVGFGYGSQWNDDFTHAIFANITGERQRHYINFGPFADVVKAFERGFVLDGTRFDRYMRFLVGTDGRLTRPTEHVVYIQNHDQVGNRPFGDRMIETHGRQRALFALTAMFASPFVPMLFMGDEYGETAPFLFFEDFSDKDLIEGVRQGRRADFDFGSAEPPDPHSVTSFLASKLRWEKRETPVGSAILSYVRTLVALKRGGFIGPRDRARFNVESDETSETLRLVTDQTLTVLNFSAHARHPGELDGRVLALSFAPLDGEGRLPPHGAAIFALPGSAVARLVPEPLIHQP